MNTKKNINKTAAMLPKLNLAGHTSIHFDSRKVTKDGIFFAIKGTQFNGEDYIEEAIERGASLVVLDESSTFSGCTVKILKVPNIRQFLAYAAAEKYMPKHPKYIAAVTGTNGKTSITYFYKQIINFLNKKCTIVGTTGVISDAEHLEGCLQGLPDATTLDPISFAKILYESAIEGIEYACVEASSHGLCQYRLDITKFCGIAFTNLTLDHMEYHLNMENYFQVKLRLFQDFANSSSIAVVNMEEEKYFNSIKQVVDKKGYGLISYGSASLGEVKNASTPNIAYKIDSKFTEVTISYIGEEVTFKPKIFAEFLVSNLCAAVGLAIASGLKFKDFANCFSEIESPPGRMQLIGEYGGAKAFVDYAHTPDALEKALQAVSAIKHKRILVLFGCGGERFHEKRFLMGKIASKYANYIIITDDNARSEDAAKIRQEILSATNTENTIEIADRREAIEHAIRKLREGDILLIAGRGHERYQYIGNEKIELSDIEYSKEVLESL